MIPDNIKNIFIDKYSTFGENIFYDFVINYAFTKAVEIDKVKKKSKKTSYVSPEIELLEYSENFLNSYRQENNIIYLNISKLFRKAAHKVYRDLLKKQMIPKNDKFINVVD